LRRTIQTAALSFGPTLARKEVPFVLVPALQEVGDIGSDTGIADTAEDLKQLLPSLFEEGELEFDLGKIDASDVKKGWNSKVSPSHRVSQSLTDALHSEAIGHTRRVLYRNAHRTSGIGCSNDLKKRSTRHYQMLLLHTDCF
jgi:hypothetical protein